MRRALSASAIALLLALVALFVWQLANRDDNAFRDALRARRVAAGARVRAAAPRQRRHVSLKSLAGQPAVLNFWASWCPPCADEAPDLNALSVRYGGLGVRFVGVDFNDAVDEARAFARRHDVPYPLVHDTRGVRQAFGVSAPPETYVLDGAGRAVVRIEGPVDTPLLEPYLRIARRAQRPRGAARSRRGGRRHDALGLARHAAARRLRDARTAGAAPTLLQRVAALRGTARVIALSEGGAVAGAPRRPARPHAGAAEGRRSARSA